MPVIVSHPITPQVYYPRNALLVSEWNSETPLSQSNFQFIYENFPLPREPAELFWSGLLRLYPALQEHLQAGPLIIIDGYHRYKALRTLNDSKVLVAVEILAPCTLKEMRQLSLEENTRASVTAGLTTHDIVNYAVTCDGISPEQILQTFKIHCSKLRKNHIIQVNLLSIFYFYLIFFFFHIYYLSF